MKVIRLNRRERILSVLVTVSLIIGFHRLGVQTQAREIANLQEQIKTSRESIQRKTEVVNHLHQQSVATLNARSDDKVFLSYLQQNQYLSNILDNLGAKSESDQVQLKVIDVQTHDQANGLHRSRFKLKIETSFVALGQFLEKLAQKPLLLEVRSVDLDRIDGDLKRCEATIEVDGYYRGGRS